MGKTAQRPDMYNAAQQTGQSGQQNVSAQTQANRPNISTPFGFQQWGTGPDGKPQLSSGFSGPLAGAASSLQGQIGDSFSKPMDDGSAARDSAINAAWGQSTSRLDPQWDQRQEQLQTQLANQGLDANSEASHHATADFSRDRNDAYSSAMNNAIGQGTAAGQATFNQNMQARQMPLQNLLSMYGGLNQTPGFNAAGVAAPTNFLGAAQAQGGFDLNNASAQNQMYGQLFQQGGQLAGQLAKLPFSF